VSKKKALGSDPLSWIRSSLEEQEAGEGGEGWHPTEDPPPLGAKARPSGTGGATAARHRHQIRTGGEGWEERQPMGGETRAPGGSEQRMGRGRRVPKFQTYPIKLTVRIGEDHLEYLSKLERKIMKNRSAQNRNERITKNSILRAVINVLKKVDMDTAEIPDEETLERRLEQALISHAIAGIK